MTDLRRTEEAAGVPYPLQVWAVVTRVCVVAAPAILIAWLTWRFAANLPLIDDWSMVDDIDAYLRGEWTLAEVFRSHNGHRIAIPRLLLVPLAGLTDWNTRIPLALSWLVMCLGAVILGRRLAPGLEPVSTRLRTAVALVATTAWFSANQFESWMWGLMLHSFLGVVASLVVLSVLSAAHARAPRLAIAAVAAVVASYNHALGLLAWPLGLVVLALSPRRASQVRALAAWGALGTLAWVVYFLPVVGDANPPRELYVLANPLGYAYFALTFLGAPAVSWSGSAWPPSDSGVGFAAGLVALGALGWGAWVVARQWGFEHRWIRFACGTIGFALGAACLTGLARGSGGGAAAFASRYATWATPMWLIVLVVLAREAGSVSSRSSWLATQAARVGLLALSVSIAASSITSIPQFAGRSAILSRLADALYHGQPDSMLVYIQPELEQIRHGRPLLERHRLSVFSGLRPPLLAEPKPLPTFGQRVDVAWTSSILHEGRSKQVHALVTNSSPEAWPHLGSEIMGSGAVALAARWLQEGAVVREGPRTRLPHDLASGASLVLEPCLQPPQPGRYQLEIGLLQEGVAWFADHGSVGWRRDVEVVPSRMRPVHRALAKARYFLLGSGCG